MPRADAPIGVFDSGIGGISVLRALRAALPHDDFVYFADSAHAPYGERDDAHVQARSRAVLAELQAAHGIKAFVIACNTATAAAAEALRAAHPDQVIVGIEPALKPALTLTRTGRIGVLATRGTLASPKFRALHHGLATRAEFVLQPCDGLATAIEKEAACADGTSARALIDQYLSALGPLGADPAPSTRWCSAARTTSWRGSTCWPAWPAARSRWSIRPTPWRAMRARVWPRPVWHARPLIAHRALCGCAPRAPMRRCMRRPRAGSPETSAAQRTHT